MHNKRLKERMCFSLWKSGRKQKGMWLEEMQERMEYRVRGKKEDEITDRSIEISTVTGRE